MMEYSEFFFYPNYLRKLKDANKPKEKDIRKSIQQYLDMKGIFNFRQWQGQFSVRGIPDIIGIIPISGRILGIEVKLPGWKLNPNSKHESEQVEFLENIIKSGGIAFFATSIEDVESQLMIKRKED